MAWISVKEFADLTGKSRQAVLKAIAKGKLKAQQIEAPGARGLVYEVWADNQELTTADNQELTTADNQELTTADNQELTTADNQELTTADNQELTTADNQTGLTIMDRLSYDCANCVRHRMCAKCCRMCTEECESKIQACPPLWEHCGKAADETGTDFKTMYKQLYKTKFCCPHARFQEQSEELPQIDTNEKAQIATNVEAEKVSAELAASHASQPVPAAEHGSDHAPALPAVVKDSLTSEDLKDRLKPVERPAEASVTVRNDRAVGVGEAVPDLTGMVWVPEKYQVEAQLKAKVVEYLIELRGKSKDKPQMGTNESTNNTNEKTGFRVKPGMTGTREPSAKRTALLDVLQLFNSKMLVPELFELTGAISERTLYRWSQDYVAAGKNWAALAPRYTHEIRGRKVPDEIQLLLLKQLLTPNRVMIGTAIRNVQAYCRVKKLELICSERTMMRWVEDWKAQNLSTWVLKREGTKAFQEKLNKTILRDKSLLEVGDVLISDGHVLSNQIIDPISGKPKRFTLVAWFDWRSGMPVGMMLNLTENTEVIDMSLRNAVLFMGFTPLWLYIDNGKAFRAAVYADKQVADADFEEIFMGRYSRLGCGVTHSLPYNAKAKVIERWWLTLQNHLERCLPGFSGAGIDDKPATMERNEKWLQARHPREYMTVEQFKEAITYWAIEIYGKSPSSALGGLTPLEVFQSGIQKIGEDRRIDAAQLNFLMLRVEKRVVQNQGVNLNGKWYYHRALLNHVGSNARLRWDPFDIRSILVFDEQDRPICQAMLRADQHPLIHIATDKPVRERELKAEIAEIRGIERDAKQAADKWQQKIGQVKDDFGRQMIAENDLFSETPLIAAPAVKGGHEKELEELLGELPQMDTNERAQMNTNDLRESGEEKAESGEEEDAEIEEILKTSRYNQKRSSK